MVGKQIAVWEVSAENIIERGWLDEYQPVGTLKITATPAQHLSGRGLFDRKNYPVSIVAHPDHRPSGTS